MQAGCVWLARHSTLQGQGITLSRLQQLMGSVNIRRGKLSRRLTVAVDDAQARWPVANSAL